MSSFSPLLAEADAYVDDCFRHERVPHATELARRLGTEPWTLTRRFQSEAGVAPSAYLKARQVRHAVALLQTTTLTTAEVAYRAGFVSRRTLFRAFRRMTGRSPNDFRSPSSA